MKPNIKLKSNIHIERKPTMSVCLGYVTQHDGFYLHPLFTISVLTA